MFYFIKQGIKLATSNITKPTFFGVNLEKCINSSLSPNFKFTPVTFTVYRSKQEEHENNQKISRGS
jgi:hypothetical protein